jgi:hypothetical protein
MEMQKSRAEREKVYRVSHMLYKHHTPAFAQASLGLPKPCASFRLTSQFMDGKQTKHNVR